MDGKLMWNRRATRIHTTLYIALPLDWARANKIDRYSDILLELMPDGSLKVSPEVGQND
jgi:hypothetical protein